MKKAIQWTRGERIARLCVFGTVFGLAVLALWFSVVEGRGWPELKEGSDLELPLAKLKANKPFLFRYRIDSYTLAPVVVQKGADGSIRAAFAVCRPCFRSGSYEWSGKVMCGHCRHVMKMADAKTEVGATKSSCALPRLEYALEGDRLSVRGATIQSEFSRQFLGGQ